MNNALARLAMITSRAPTGNTNSFIVSVGSSDGTMQAQSGIMADNFGSTTSEQITTKRTTGIA